MQEFKVLLVDDETEFVSALAERLSLRGIDVEVAFNGEQALAFFMNKVPEVMVLDLKMPGIGGMEVLRRVMKSHPEVQVIILTGHGSDKDEEQALHLGAYSFLKKPAEFDVLFRAITNAINSKRPI